jgi:CPA2 family monovalent cation:H+ antiporter-2
MSETHFLQELLIVLTATIAIVVLFHKLRVPAVVGFLLAGVVIGPGGLGLIKSPNQVETLAESAWRFAFTIGVERR